MKIPRLFFASLALASSLLPLSSYAAGWQATSPLSTTRGAAGVLEVNGKIYVIGGVDGWRFLNSSEFTTVQPDGTLGAWQKATQLKEDRGFFGVAEHKGHIYAVGGGNGPNGHNLLRTIERATLQADGSIGEWQTEAQQLNFPRRCAKVVAMGGYLYALGGFSGTLLDSIERAPIKDDGSLGAWEILPEHFTLPRYIQAVAHSDNAMYAIGGHTEKGGTGIDDVEFATLQADGKMSAWQASPKLKQGRYGLAAALHGSDVYALGGLNGATFFDAIERSHINADGSLGEWQAVAPMPAPFADMGVITYRDWMYLIGGTNRDGYYDSVYMTRIADLNSTPSTDKANTTAAVVPSKPMLMPNEGNVAQTIDGGTYLYIEIDFGNGTKEWIATGKIALEVGDHVRYSKGIFMKDFYSKTLKRTFEVIRFVSKVEKVL